MRGLRPALHEGDLGPQKHADQLVDDEPHERLHAVLVLGPHHKEERHGLRMVHEVHDLEIRARHVPGDKRIAVERQEGHGGGENRAALLVGTVHHVAGGAGDGDMNGAVRTPLVLDHLQIERHDLPVGVGERERNIGQGAHLALGPLLIEHMQDCAGEKGVARLGPMVDKPLALGIDKNGHEVLHVAHFVQRAEPDLLERVEAHASLLGARIELHDDIAGLALPPGGGQVPELRLLVVDDDAVRPGQERRNDKADALAGPCRRDRRDMLRPVVAEIAKTAAAVAPAADIDAFAALSLFRKKARRLDFLEARPMRGAVNALVAFRIAAAYREQPQNAEHQAHRQTDHDRLEHGLRADAEPAVPHHPLPGRIDMPVKRRPERGMVGEPRSYILRGGAVERDDRGEKEDADRASAFGFWRACSDGRHDRFFPRLEPEK